METIDVEISDFTLRSRSMLVSHVSTSLSRGLEPGEQVVLRDGVRGHFSAYVADIGFEPSDTIYRLKIGVRLTAEEADERRRRVVTPAPAATATGTADTLTKQDLLDLLGQLRAGGRTVPAGRHRRESRTDTAL